MTESLDTILSGRETASAQETTTEQTVTQATNEATADTGGDQTTEQTTEAEGGAAAGQKMVPHEALHAEKQKVKRYTEEVAEFRKANETLSRQVTELLTRVPVPKVEQQQSPPRPDVFEDPNGFLEAGVREGIDPIRSELGSLREFYSRKDAIREHGKEKVQSAFGALHEAAVAGDPDARAVVSKVKQSMDPFGEIMDWHNKQVALTEIGDPAAFREKVRAELEAEILAKHGLTAETVTAGGDARPRAPAAAQAAPVMPSNLATARNVGARSGPAWGGPVPLGDIFKR